MFQSRECADIQDISIWRAGVGKVWASRGRFWSSEQSSQVATYPWWATASLIKYLAAIL